MSIVKYKCDTCKREVQLLENLYGMTVFSKCVITDGCKGKLYVLQRNQDSVRELYPNSEPNLDDYTPRRVFLEFEQSNASNIWKIKHNMSVLPSISVYENVDNTFIEIDEEEYTLTNIENNQLHINFPEPKFGVAHLIARSSVPLVPETKPSDAIRIQLTNNGIMTFAIPEIITHTTPEYLASNIDIDLEICIEVPDLEEVVCTENIEPTIDLASPWATWDKILIRNRRFFRPRTKHILDMNVFNDSKLVLTDIVDGTKLSFKRIVFGEDGKYQDIKSKQLLMLFSEYPHARVDKVLDRFLDIGELMHEDENYLSFENGELFANINSIEATYPLISKYVEIDTPVLPTPTPTSTPTPTLTPTPSAVVSALTVVISGTTSDFCENLIEATITFSAPVTIQGGGSNALNLENEILFTDSNSAAFPISINEDSPGVFTLEFSTNDLTTITITVPADIAVDAGLNDNLISNVHEIDVQC